MRVIAHRKLEKFYLKHSDAKTAIESWYTTASSAEWRCLSDIKKDFSGVDRVGNRQYVFNIKGNDYRLEVEIKFQIQMIYICFIGTHDEYDQTDSSSI